MTETTIFTEQEMTCPAIPSHPTDILLHVIIAFLAPMFLSVSGGDTACARMAAIETVSAYRAQSHADLIAIAQIVAFGLAALGSLSLSMADNIPISMTLRLRGNANACNRSAEQNRRALREARSEPATPANALAEADLNEAQLITDVASAQDRAAETNPACTPRRRSRTMPQFQRPLRPRISSAKRHGQPRRPAWPRNTPPNSQTSRPTSAGKQKSAPPR